MKLINRPYRRRGQFVSESLVQGNAEFALALYHELRTRKGNLFFSPYSISTALAMTYAGARGNTEAQMAQALRFLLNQDQLHVAFALLDAKLSEMGKKGNFQLEVANSLWPQEGYIIREEFIALVKQFYGVVITAVNYGNTDTARRTINTWVMEKTDGKIREIIPRGMLDKFTRLMLVNGIYFKGSWSNPFDRDLTRESPFWVTPDEQVQVMTMTQKQLFGYREGDGFKILELPYTRNNVSMILFLPDELDGLVKFESTLSLENLDRWINGLQRIKIEIYIPRFEMDSAFRLDDTLQSMGMADAFSSEANFSGIEKSNKLYLSSMLHKAFIDVDEKGTTTAAATAGVATLGLPAAPPVFRADHPFVFLIRENSTGSILFLGRVVRPV